MPRRENQTTPFLQGDLVPRITDDTDLRNDFAGSSLQQRESILLRYLESLPAEDQVDLDTLRENITRRYPFHGDGSFREAMDALEKDGWIKVKNGLVQLDKVARVTRRFLARSMSGGTR
jgi:hypothetical protein